MAVRSGSCCSNDSASDGPSLPVSYRPAPGQALQTCVRCFLRGGLLEFFAGVGLQFKPMAWATSVDDVFARLEADSFFLRVDTTVAPTMSRGAMVSEAKLALLRQIGAPRCGQSSKPTG